MTDAADRLYDITRIALHLTVEAPFMQMAFALCNELAIRYHCERVTLGWVRGNQIELVAISQIEKFDRKSNAVRHLEQAMEEAYDQGCSVSYPAVTAGQQVVNRAHEYYMRQQGSGYALSLPVISGEWILAVICLERQSAPLDESTVWELALLLELCTRALYDRYQRDRGLGLRLRDGAGTLRIWLTQPVHTSGKLAGLMILLLLLALLSLPWNYRIDTTAILRSKDLLFLTAPFDGFLSSVHVEVGDRIEPEQLLVTLDTRDLLQQEAIALADVSLHQREAEKAQANRQLAEMRIAQAQHEQSQAKLALVRHQLAQAALHAPNRAIVIEGDLKKNLGAPVRRGDLLLKLASTDNIYFELIIDEADIHEINLDMSGDLALVGRPEEHFTVTIERIEPMATAREGRNVYLARARLHQGKEQAWWRPGMGGNVKLDAGKRPIIWVLTHRTIRYLRQLFWL